MEKTLC